MLLIDALYVNHSGGEVLLNQLAEALHRTRREVVYLIDARMRGRLNTSWFRSVVVAESGIWKRHTWYLRHADMLTSVLVLSGIPPTIRLNCPVRVYCQNPHLVHPLGLKSDRGRHRWLKSTFVRTAHHLHPVSWIVQTRHMERHLRRFLGDSAEHIDILPFFPEPDLRADREFTNRFLYVSDGYEHKNHDRLLEAFLKHRERFPDSELHLTISPQYPELKARIARTKGNGIVDHGFLPYPDVLDLYRTAGCVVYPSLSESLGIGLIEGAQAGLPILASDLEFATEIIRPSATFDPADTGSMAAAMDMVRNGTSTAPARLRIRNQLPDLIRMLVTP